ncbi:udp-glucuronosyl udp-glucosyltransferase [Stagonosporopsis vannaccii]|nr:udp-glucuronosyl udp-glucosyltransferase [Stagonosporopsis vannaccii]
MVLNQRILVLAIVPLITLVALQSYLHSYFYPSSIMALFGGKLPDRSETPIVVSAVTHWSHYEKIAKVAVVLANLGYPIIFITGRIFEKDVQSLHPRISFHPFIGGDDKMSAEDYDTYMSKAPGLERELFIMRTALIGSMRPGHETLQQVFREFRDKYGKSKPLISLFDTPVIGHHPVLLGAPGIKPDASVIVSCHPLTMNSNDSFPFYVGKAPHTGPDARAVHRQAISDQQDDYQTFTLSSWYWEALKEHEAYTDRYLMDSMHSVTDQILSLGVPEFEFPRSDIRPVIHYFGALKNTKDEDVERKDLPTWWSEVVEAKRQGKKIVAVSQGTVETDLNDLVLPTLEALKHREDVITIATTVAVEPTDVENLVVPRNAHVAKFIPYDLLLPMVDALVNNGGYGAVIKALEHGVPLVVGGEGQDKAITNAIVQWSGVGVHVGGRSPGLKSIRDGIEKILADASYKQKAEAMSKNFERYDAATVIDGVIQGIVQDWATKKY